MPISYFKGLGGCGVEGWDITPTIDESTTVKTIYTGPLVPGTWGFDLGALDGTLPLDLHHDMFRIYFEQVAYCGLIHGGYYGSHMFGTEYIFPCWDGVIQYNYNVVAFNGSATPVDLCTNGAHVETVINPSAVLCPVEECTLSALKITMQKQPGSGSFWIKFYIAAYLIAPL